MAGPRKSTTTGANTTARPRKLTTSGVDRGRLLADFLAERLAIDPADADTLIRRGAVYLGRRRIEDPAHVLAAGHRVTVHLASPPPAAVATLATGPAAAAPAPTAPAAVLAAAAPTPTAPAAVPAAAAPSAAVPAAAAPSAAVPAATPTAAAPSAAAPAAAAPSAAVRAAARAAPTPDASNAAPARSGAATRSGAWPSGAPASRPEARPATPSASADGLSSSASVAGLVSQWLVYQDPEVLVIDKPAGVASQATRASSAGALDRLVADAIDRDARLLHRLDRDASGLVLFARTPEARRRFADLLARYQLERTYFAAVWGHWARAEGALSGSIGRDPRDHRRMAVGPGRPALTRFRLIRRGTAPDGQPVSLLQIDLVTGRTHQIRVHLADAGHAICGDALYGSDRPRLDRLFLHAHRLAWPGAAPVLAPVPPLLSDLVG